MFLGHVAAGFAAKRLTPRISLALLVLAAQLADTLWPILVGLGVEVVAIDPGNTAVTPLDFVSYPYSHSLVLLALWGVVFAWIFAREAGAPQNRAPRTLSPFVVLVALVVSHWVLDVISHRPDVPLYPGGGPKLGLGLWNSIAATVAVELLMYGAGIWIYLRSTRARDRSGTWGFASLAMLLAIVYAANIAGPPPPSVDAIWIAATVAVPVLMLWAWWADRHREII